MNAAKLRATLIAAEGKRYVVYDDATSMSIHPDSFVRGEPTIGVGRNLAARGLDDAEIEFLLANDMAQSEASCNAIFGNLAWAGFPEVRQRAFVEMTFQLGAGGLRSFTRAREAAIAGEWELCADELLSSKWAKETPHRVNRIATMIRTGNDA